MMQNFRNKRSVRKCAQNAGTKLMFLNNGSYLVAGRSSTCQATLDTIFEVHASLFYMHIYNRIIIIMAMSNTIQSTIIRMH